MVGVSVMTASGGSCRLSMSCLTCLASSLLRETRGGISISQHLQNIDDLAEACVNFHQFDIQG